MKYSKRIAKQAVISAVVASMVVATPVWAEISSTTGAGQTSTSVTTGASLKTSFPDVPVSFWGIKHITKLALEGVIEGDESGFHPNDSVSQQDAVIMMIRALGLESEALKINADATAIGLDVRSDAKPYVIEAIDKGIIDIQEELPIVSDKGWGYREASREWIAKLIIRAIGKKDEAASLAGQPTSFLDNADISASALGFVGAAVAHKIVEGSDDGKFHPLNPVKRAELAAILSRSDKEIPYQSDRVVSGYVQELTAGSIKLTTTDGRTLNYSLGADTVYYSFKNETTPVTAADVKTLNQVNVIQSAGKAYYIEVINDVPPIETITGTVEEMVFEQMQLIVNVQGEKKTLNLATGVSVVEANGQGSSLRALTEGSVVDVKRSLLDGSDKYTQVVVQSFAVNKTTDGTITNVDIAGKTVTVDEKEGGSATYPISDSIVLTTKGTTLTGISQLRIGDGVHYQVKAGAVVALDVTVPYVEPVDTGKFVEISSDNTSSYVTISKNDGKPPISYYIAKDVEVAIQGVLNPVLKDIQVGDDLRLDLDKQNAVKKITVTSRSVKTRYMTKIVSYDDNTKYLLVDENGTPNVYVLSDKATYFKDGRAYTLATIGTYLTKDRKIDMTISGEKTVLSIAVSASYEGTISQVNAVSGDLMLKLTDEQYVSFKIGANPAIELANISNATVANLTVGDSVTVTLNPSQDVIAVVKSKKTTMGRLVGVNASLRQIGVKDTNGSVYTYTLGDNIPITIGTKPVYSYSELPLEEPIQLTFNGTSITKVFVPVASRGKVTAVDTTQGKVTIDGGAGPQTISVTKPKIMTNGLTSDVLTTLKVNDRVELVSDIDGSTRIIVAKQEDRSVDTYDSFSKILVLKRKLLNDQTSYTFHPKANIHKGSDVYNPNYLMAGDQVRIYTIDGKIVEMEKL